MISNKDILFKEKRLTESFGKDNIEKAVMYRIEYQTGYSSLESRDAWVTAIYPEEELLYIIKYIIYNFIKHFYEDDYVIKEFRKCAVNCTRGEMIADILIEHYGCTGHIPEVPQKNIEICFISHEIECRYLKEKSFESDDRFAVHHKHFDEDLKKWIIRYMKILSKRKSDIGE